MKITPDKNTEMNASQKIDTQSAGNKLGVAGADRLIPDAMTEKSNFASVLDRVTRSHNDARDRSENGKSTASSETRERKTSEDDTATDDVQPANVERTVMREPVPVNEVETSSRPLVHNVDMNSIVTACQVQLAANGQKEVTLQLSHSMLEGLRVKLTSDGAGRINAEFLAATEGIKSLLDGRSAELIEQLRSRGINLAEFRSSLAADANSRNDSQQQQSPERNGETRVVAALDEPESTDAVEDGLAAGATYRA
ncbi:MAG TPA: flagellar hook-length control protein FliK [Pyrinomonadaceae bacterium]|nr:flagellar hook-length control protein FliK [Pyrinomonadaceae bacterium]